MMVATSGEQWLSFLEHGITWDPMVRSIVLAPVRNPPAWADIVVHIDVPLCLADGINILQDNQGGLYTFGSTLRGVLFPKYFLKAVDVPTGWQIYPEETGLDIMRREESEMANVPTGETFMDMPLGELDGGEQGPNEEEAHPSSRPLFRFQSQLPPEERAAYLRSRTRGGVPPRVGMPQDRGAMEASPSHVMDEDWDEPYTQSPC